ncbi:hypothetical protein PHLGIDRAFT_126876 [Phlebiopsis gigantea 11061_1 CR5-6]|uniref:Uncharacterized protein n=1 Tax=Phlebiopsis gigantea (strain 11061_1 CR5-6) TaxID=745531 RepID=A0A0C3SCB1_PHLG1|nr:hypothetical protein PHLGIDRAFT_126876 [Phlebiopsis gigantea 11061_1 CR5-6]
MLPVFNFRIHDNSASMLKDDDLSDDREPKKSITGNVKWRRGIPPQPPQQDYRLHPQAAASGSGVGIPFAASRSVPTTMPELGHSWESGTTEGSSVVGTPAASPSRHPRDRQQFGDEDWNPRRASPATASPFSAMLDGVFPLSLEDSEPAVEQEDVPKDVDTRDSSAGEPEGMEELDELEIRPMMAKLGRPHVAGLDMGFQDPTDFSRSLLFGGSVWQPFQLPSPRLSPLREMDELPSPLFD